MQRRICLAEVFAETSHAEEDLFSGECSRISDAEEDLFSGTVWTVSGPRWDRTGTAPGPPSSRQDTGRTAPTALLRLH